jgi:hypothetical protein
MTPEARLEKVSDPIYAAHHPREDWDAQFAAIAKDGNDPLLDETAPTDFDQSEWTW